MKNKVLLSTLFVLSFVNAVWAQNPIISATEQIRFSKKNFVDTISIKVINGAVVVPIEIEGKVKNFLFDTGCPTGVWFGRQEPWMKRAEVDTLSFSDINHVRRQQSIYYIPKMKMGSLHIYNYPTILNEEGINKYVCGRFDGMIGFNLVGKGLSFKFDTKDSLLIVTDRKNFFTKESKGLPKAKYKTHNDYRPIIEVETPFGVVESLFDSGATNVWFVLNDYDMNSWSLKNAKNRMKYENLTVLMDTTINAQAGLYGMHTDTMIARYLHFATTKIGKLPISDLYVKTERGFSKVGSALLKHTSLIIDAHKQRFVFVPHEEKNIRAENGESGSVSFVPSDTADSIGAIRVVVRRCSDAYSKGVRTGDYLISIDHEPITDICILTRVLAVLQNEYAIFQFSSPEGVQKEVRLKSAK
ncbi:MAG: hypothetical protein K6G73_11265 [Marinilabiliaceae bacterium]|nr:hypothetical protein [Marinilabiliaceae bacterium]